VPNIDLCHCASKMFLYMFGVVRIGSEIGSRF
jgi:hypothetical protein